MTMRELPHAAALSEFQGYTGDCLQDALLAALHTVDPARFPLDASTLNGLVRDCIAHGWSSANGSSPIDTAAHLCDEQHIAYTNYGYGEPFSALDWRAYLDTWGGVKPIVLEYARAGAGLPGDEAGVNYHYNACVGWDPAAHAGLFADGDNWQARGGVLARYTLANLEAANVCGVFVLDAVLTAPAPGTGTGGSRAMLELTQVADFYADASQDADVAWRCKTNGCIVHGGILSEYRQMTPIGGGDLAGMTLLGLPLDNEVQTGPQTWEQRFERGILAHDAPHLADNPPGSKGPVYLMHTDHLYTLSADVQQQADALNAMLTAAQRQIQANLTIISNAHDQVAKLTSQHDADTQALAATNAQIAALTAQLATALAAAKTAAAGSVSASVLATAFLAAAQALNTAAAGGK